MPLQEVETVYKKMCKAVEINEEDGLKDDEVSEPFKMGENLMHSELAEAGRGWSQG
jgi:hypothetical protein